jgi:hypothetical protein
MALGGEVSIVDIPIGIAFLLLAFILMSISLCYRKEEKERIEQERADLEMKANGSGPQRPGEA